MIQDSSNCARCGSQIRPQAKFCGKCGEAAGISCPECEVINPVGDRYCYDCGSQLRPPPWVLDPDYPDTQTGSSGPAPPPRPAAVGPVSCQRCHTANEPGAAYCYQCGLPLDEEAEPRLTTPPLDDATVSDYVSSRTRANWTIGLTAGVCLALLLHIAILNWQLDLVTDGGSARAMLVAIEGVELAVGLQLLLWGASIIAFLMWEHRVSKNLPTIGMHGQRYSPGWAVGWWFIPIANLFMPYLVMAEIWRGSTASFRDAWDKAPVPSILKVWWCLFISTIVFSVLSGPLNGEGYPTGGPIIWGMLWSAATFIEGSILIYLVKRITDSQEQKSRHRTSIGQ